MKSVSGAPASTEVGRAKFRFNRGYLALSLVILVVEVLIATLGAGQPFLRGYVGDALVVVLLYTAVAAVHSVRPGWLALGVFGFACLVEVFQYLGGADLLRLDAGSWQQIVVGTTFSWGDVLSYAIGCGLSWLLDSWWRRRRA